MLKIGIFSKLSRTSIRMLRHYDEIGLLKPIIIDEFTGYRYYGEEQLTTMARINSLKDMGFALSAVKDLLSCFDNKEEIERHFQIRRAELLAMAEETEQRLRFLDTAIDRLRKEETMNYDVVLKTLPERKVASVRQTIPSYDQEGKLWHVLFQETASMNLVLAEPPLMSVVLHDKEFRESDVDVEVQTCVKGEYQDTENVRFKTEPESTVASTIFKGSYGQFSAVYAALAAWVSANGYVFSGPMLDIYHVSPHETDNPEEYVTEVCCPVSKK